MSEHMKVMLAGISSLILTLGIARFSYTPLLHIMQEQTSLNDAIGGWLAAFNYTGYLSGAIIAASINNLKLKDTLYRYGLIMAVITTIGMAWTENWMIWAVLRYLAGLSSAAGLLLGSGLILNWLIRHGYKMELGIHFAGLGLGIALTAIAVELMLLKFNWAEQWLVFALIGLLFIFPAWFWLPRPDGSDTTKQGESLIDKPPSRNWMRLLSASYFCAGVGYVINATFIVVIIDSQPELNGYGNWAWLVIGLVGAPSCIFWDRVTRKLGEFNSFILAYALQIFSILLLAFDVSVLMLFLCAGIYGVTVFGIVSMMLTMAGKLYPTKPAKLMGKVSLYYALAQIIAPAIGGSVAEVTGNYSIVLIASAIIMIAGLAMLIKLMKIPQ